MSVLHLHPLPVMLKGDAVMLQSAAWVHACHKPLVSPCDVPLHPSTWLAEKADLYA